MHSLLQRCYQWAQSRWFQPRLLIAALLLTVLTAVLVFVQTARSEYLLPACILAFWLLLALAFRFTFGQVPAAIEGRGLRVALRRFWRFCWQRFVLILVIVTTLACLLMSLRLLALAIKLLLLMY